MTKANRPVNDGWYVSQEEFIGKGYAGVTLYLHENGNWSDFKTGEALKVTDLPVPPHEMWPVRLVKR